MTNPKIETDLANILEKIDSKIDKLESKIEQRFDKVDERLNNIETGQAVLKGKLESQQAYISKIPELAEKVGELKNWRQIAVIIITGTASTVFGWFLRSGRM